MVYATPRFRGQQPTDGDAPSLDIPALAALLQAANRSEDSENSFQSFRDPDALLREADEAMTLLPEHLDSAQRQAVRATLVKLFKLMDVLD